METVSDPSALRARLRAATGEAHERLERELALLDPDAAGPVRVAALLRRFFGFHAVWEPALARALPEDAALLVPRRKLALLAADLAALDGVAAPMVDLATLRRAAPAAALCATPAQALGSLYVLEGSTLGGQVVARHLRAHAPWLPPTGLRYFDPYGAETGLRWRETLARLAAEPPAATDAIVAGAVRTFEFLCGWLPPGAAQARAAIDGPAEAWP